MSRRQPRSLDRGGRRLLWLCAGNPGHQGIQRVAAGPLWQCRASALAQIDARYDRNALIVADLSNDTSYAEQLFDTFGPRVIGVHIGRYAAYAPRADGPEARRAYAQLE